MDFLSSFITVVLIVVLAIPGFFLRKSRLLPDNAAKVLAVLLLYISQPFLMMSSILNKPFQHSMLLRFAMVIGLAVVLQIFVYLIAKVLFFWDKNLAAKRAAVASSYLGNVGFMGIPVMQMLFPGNDALVLYTVVYNIAFNAMTWTLGVYAITGERRHVNPLKILLNPPTIAVAVALPFYFCNFVMPDMVMRPIQYLGEMTLPLSMIILGIRLADMRLTSIINHGRIFLASSIKLILSPLVCLGAVFLLRCFVPVDRFVFLALFIIAAMPTASSALNFAEMYGGDCETAAAITFISTVFCIITIPVMMLLCNWI